jgi:hypothetical protein
MIRLKLSAPQRIAIRKQAIDTVPHGLKIAETIADRALQGGQRGQQAIVGRPPQDFPEAFKHIQLGTITRQSIQFHMRALRQHLGDRVSSSQGALSMITTTRGHWLAE